MHEATTSVLRYFDYQHLPANLAAYSQPFHDLAHYLVEDTNLVGPEVTAGLRKLLEAKDCFVRAAIDIEHTGHVPKLWKDRHA